MTDSILRPGRGGKVTPVPPTEVDQIEFDGSVVVALTVEPLVATPAPCYVTDQGVENGSYRRWDDQDLHLTSYEIYPLRHRHELTPTDREPVVGASLSDLDSELVDRVIGRLRSQGSRALVGATQPVEQLQRLNIVTAGGVPTLAGLMSAGPYPQQFLPQLFVDVAVHPGITKSDPRTPIRFVDRQVCEGPIPIMAEQAIGAVLRNLRTSRVVEGTRGVDVPEIPKDVLREAIVNALTHRDTAAGVVDNRWPWTFTPTVWRSRARGDSGAAAHPPISMKGCPARATTPWRNSSPGFPWPAGTRWSARTRAPASLG